MNFPRDFTVRWRVRLGYPLALVCFWLAHPTRWSLAVGGGIGLAGLLLRAVAAGHLRKYEQLATSGPYAFTRNPLYFGSALLAVGLLIAALSELAAFLVIIYFAVVYPAVMRKEEAELRARYGAAFDAYAARVPLFWPRLTPRVSAAAIFTWENYRRNREYQALLGFLAALVVLLVKLAWKG
jgi:protein-S-isoprenylcysteine O-methyltransferase Ste14